MKKFYNVLKAILISLLVVVGIAVVIGYIFWQQQTKEILDMVVNFVNKPLPIVGVSLVVVFMFVYKCFVTAKYGKSEINELKDKYEATKTQVYEKEVELKEKEDEIKALVNAHQSEIDLLLQYVSYLYENNKNQDVREHGKQLLEDYSKKQSEIVNDLGVYGDSFLVSLNQLNVEEISKLVLENIKKELGYGEERIDSDTKEE